ncbi:MAG: Fic family protein [bacterium]
MFFEEIDKKIKLLNSKKPFPEYTLQSLRENLILEWTYNSNAIEGNTLTLQETKVVMEGITIGGKSIREHFEVINHREAILYVEDIIKNKEPLTEWQIKNIHNLVLKNIDDKNAGIYRKSNVVITGAKFIPPDFLFVPEQMNALIDVHNNNYSHPLEKAALLHTIFVKIHPFVDGNGRTARLLLNFELMKNGYLPIIIKKENRLEYYASLDKAHISGDYTDFINITAKLENEILDFYLKIIG